jgi:hypothetical protein
VPREAAFEQLRCAMIEKYLEGARADHQIAHFLLNDIIRYWRTITVDYEHKIGEQQGKPWAIRNIKLAFSRKLLYASGLFSVAMTADRTAEVKRETLLELFSLPALDRIEAVCGEALARPIRKSYDIFLEAIESPEKREHLDGQKKDRQDRDPVFRGLKNEAHHYSRALLSAFEMTFHATHPIRHAVIF